MKSSPLIFLAFATSGVFLCHCFEGEAIPESPGFKSSEITIPDSPGIKDTQGANNEQIVVNEELVTSNEDKLNSLLEGSGAGELYHEFTSEEIERHRIITTFSNGTETISSDEEAILTLKYVRATESINFLHSEPHFVNQIYKRLVHGHDNRGSRNQNSAPYSAMGYLYTSGVGRCTAFLVGPRHIVTAAHCLHPGSSTSSIVHPSQVSFYLRRSCNPDYSGIRRGVQQILTYNLYRNSGEREYDVACLLLSSTLNNWMGFAYRDPMPTVTGEVCGYSSDRGQCFTCSYCRDIERPSSGWWSRNDKRLQYTCDTYPGVSGGPVTTGDHDSTSKQYAYGVHTSGPLSNNPSRNSGVRFSRDLFYDTCRWICNTGVRCSAVC